MDRIKRRFWEYHKANPQVAVELREIALDLWRRGRDRWSIDGVTEVLRWQRAIKTTDPNTHFKICNDYRPLYARYLMATTPELKDFFVIKERPLEREEQRGEEDGMASIYP